MLLIKHGATPRALEMAINELLNTPDTRCHYNNLYKLKDTGISPKDAVLNQLLDEQGHLCAYCMRPIRHKDSKDEKESKAIIAHIEHWIPKTKGTDEQSLDYENMLAVCSGTVEGTRKKDQTCDARKGDKIIKLDPRDISHIQSLSYDDLGCIRSDDPDLQTCLDDELNLNSQLPSIRKRILEETNRHIHDVHKKNSSNIPAITAILQKEISTLEKTVPFRKKFVGVTIWRLRSHVTQLMSKRKTCTKTP